ncbi:sensor histidine kinase [Hymenobacter ruricola]|uniref:histidine kinase n=1 Tax=Hymenobacter ruricola TaxID=2791023 RepID=A0ABS0I2W0_9BACT|nr:sensor histidine kinase [Hymenobacter ruricola]MBF9221292.1 sensor histidine kinase [Hymenobacter ruricola]
MNRAAAFLALLALLLAGPVRAEPLYPLLRPAQADSLRRQLWRTPPNATRLALLLALSQDLTAKNRGFGAPLDSALLYGQQALALSQRRRDARAQIGSWYALGNYWLACGQAARGARLLAQGLAASTRHHYRRLAADGSYYLSETYSSSAADIPRRIGGLQRAMGLYEAVHDGARAAYALKTIADLHMQQGQEGLARAELLQVLARYRAVGYRRLHYTHDLLGVANARLGDYNEALRYGLASIESARATADTANLNLFYYRVGNTYFILHQFDDALTYYNSARRRAERARDAGEVINAITLITEVLIAQHRTQDALNLAREALRQYPLHDRPALDSLNLLSICYLANKQFGPAEKHALQLISVLEANTTLADRRVLLLTAYLRAGQLYLAVRRYDRARRYATKAWAMRAEVSLKKKADMRLLLFKVDSAQGNFLAAIAQQQHYQLLRDSIFNERKSRQIASLQIQYDTQKKEQDMALLTKQNLVQRANLRQRETQRNASLVGAVLLALVLGLGYNRYRLRQHSNRLLESQRQEIFVQNQALEKVLTEKSGLLEEKEWMLKEIHHRVKNNLQIIGSLLRSQAVYLKDGPALAAVREGRNRVHSMALIHQKLYQSNQLTGVPMHAYVQEIVEHLLASFDCEGRVQTALAVAAVELDVALAVPLGLILNEAITNTLKYAFPAGRSGRLSIGLEAPAPGHYRLSIGDDGVGLPADFEPQQSRTLGLELIRGLSKQIGARLEVTSAHGVQIRLEFDQLVLAPRG